jgi:DNA-directed RNA polymerase subunit M/transcription elongation factor TFIIS
MPIIYGLLLQAKGEVKRVKVSDGQPITMDNLQNAVKKKTILELLTTYATKEYTLSLFGYSKGKAGTENKHELPPPNGDLTAFGDILLVASKPGQSWTHPIGFSPDQYEVFYQEQFGGENNAGDGVSQSGSESGNDEEEKEEDEEELQQSAKKRAAVEDGVPEDEEGEVEEEDDEADEEEEEEDGAIAEDDYDEEIAPKVRAAPKKKAAPTKPNMTVNQNTGRARQQALLMRPGFSELSSVKPLAQAEALEHKFRSVVLAQIKTLLGDVLTEDQRYQLETSILHSTFKEADSKYVLKHFDNNLFQLCYTSVARRVLSNLSINSYVKNTYLLPRIMNGTITIDQVATMSIRDFAPTLYTDLRERQILREQHQLEGHKAMATDMFQCFRCNKRETVFYELQTRSADEPMTKFITCVNCNNRWRM